MSAVEWRPMGTEGDELRQRRERIGMSKGDLAKHAGISRDTVQSIEDGDSVRTTSLSKVRRALEALEVEMGIDEAPSRVVTFTVQVPGQPEATVQATGPADEVAEAVAALLRRMGQEG